MRAITIPMSGAAYKRLSWLAEPERLPVPLDPDLIRPFGLRFEVIDGKSRLIVTHGRARVAMVLDHSSEGGEAAFLLHVGVGPSERVDRALRLLFARITEHLGALRSAVERRKNDDVLASYRAFDEQKEAARATLASLEKATDEEPCSDFRLTMDDIFAAGMAGKVDGVSITAIAPSSFTLAGPPHVFSITAYLRLSEQDQIPQVCGARVSTRALGRLVRRMSAIGMGRLNDLRGALATLPPPEFMLPPAAFPKPKEGFVRPRRVAMIPDWDLAIVGDEMSIVHDGRTIGRLLRHANHDGLLFRPRRQISCRGLPDVFSDEEMARLSSVWVREIAPWCGLDPEDYRIPDERLLEAEAEAARMGTGYEIT